MSRLARTELCFASDFQPLWEFQKVKMLDSGLVLIQ